MPIRIDEPKVRALAAQAGDESQYAIARRTGLNEATVSRALNGLSSPRYKTLLTIARSYGVTVEDITDNDPDDTEQAA